MDKKVEIGLFLLQFIVNVVGLSIVFVKVVKAIITMSNKVEDNTKELSDNTKSLLAMQIIETKLQSSIVDIEKRVRRIEIWKERLVPILVKLQLELEEEKEEG